MAIINLFVVSVGTYCERRFDPHITVKHCGQLKSKLELITGILSANQCITLFALEVDSNPVVQLSDDLRALGFYCTMDYHVNDTNPSVSFTGQLTNVSQIDKFELSDAEYAKHTDMVLAYKQTHKAELSEPLYVTPQLDIPIGACCEVESSEPEFSKRGTGLECGSEISVEYSEPIGKNGSIQGEHYYFT
ncbi:hypothetical protein FISHEDRAFT_63343 [Fistulina hepatica ATCC 64428]|uniref:Ubiquitin-like domain-containing protein n=1 Tax=Fistulina hepatica ATCC 64428 TaxID=1128425 RepID=A0A0D7AP29_9AGAR|nr:hypothetical protein FISHEDRAFT_63343 [Fistulina hepatica ATCC 64428]